MKFVVMVLNRHDGRYHMATIYRSRFGVDVFGPLFDDLMEATEAVRSNIEVDNRVRGWPFKYKIEMV